MRALRFLAPGVARLEAVPEPSAGAGEALVAPRHVGLCGTDLELFAGTMPYFASGDAGYPLTPGHEVAGVVVSAPDGAIAAGTEVLVDPVVGCDRCPACGQGLASRCPDRRELGIRRGLPGGAAELIAAPLVNLHPLPASLATAEAVLAEPGVTALNAVERLGAVEGRAALVLGAGTLGLIAAQLLRRRGAAVDVVVAEPGRRDLVERLGLDPVARAEPSRYPFVIEAAGVAATLHDSLAALAPGGTLAVIGVQPAPVDALDVNQLVLKDASAHGVLNGPGLYDRMLAALADGEVEAAPLIDSVHELDDAAAALERLRFPGRPAPKVVLAV